MSSKKCFKCGEVKALTLYYRHSEMADGHLNKCKECTKKDSNKHRSDNIESVREYDRNRPNSEERNLKNATRGRLKYNSDDEYRRGVLESKREHSDRNPDKRLARAILSNALRDGGVIKGSSCEHCGEMDRPLEGHHWSYLEQHALDVNWLCASCHGKEHKRLNEEDRNNTFLI